MVNMLLIGLVLCCLSVILTGSPLPLGLALGLAVVVAPWVYR